MKSALNVRVLDFSVLREIEGFRTAAHFAALLDAMEFGETAGLSEDELRDLCLMSLQDRKPEEAAELVLQHDLGDRLRPGQIRNLAVEMLDDKLWEEHSDLSLHERFFNVGSLLHAAFPRSFPLPDAVKVRLEVVATYEAGRSALTEAARESFLVRLVADGMEPSAALRRMFDDQLAGKPFPQADTIVWTAEVERIDPRTVHIEILSSGYWLDPLREARSYESTARADAVPER